jgi:hypothetical protein
LSFEKWVNSRPDLQDRNRAAGAEWSIETDLGYGCFGADLEKICAIINGHEEK